MIPVGKGILPRRRRARGGAAYRALRAYHVRGHSLDKRDVSTVTWASLWDLPEATNRKRYTYIWP